MNLSRAANTRIRAAVHAVATRAHEAEMAPDLDAMKRALNEVWHAVHDARETINQAERETREDALARLNQRDAA
jgi:hypothetical protein